MQKCMLKLSRQAQLRLTDHAKFAADLDIRTSFDVTRIKGCILLLSDSDSGSTSTRCRFYND